MDREYEGGADPGGGGKLNKQDTRIEVDKVFDFLMQIPPDWEMAEKHGRANLCVNSALTTLDLHNPDSFCPCCQMPYPSEGDEQFFSILDDNEKLGDLGEGFPVFFYLIKYMTWLMFILSIIYFCPTIYFMLQAYERVKSKMTAQDEPLSMFSLGVFVKYSKDTKSTELSVFQKQEEFIESVTACMMAAIFITLIGSIFLRRRLLQKAISVDVNATTPSDFALLGDCPEFGDDCDFSKEKV